jgi:hypothetical protein
MKTIFSILLALCSLFATAQTSLSVKVTDAKTGEALFGVNVLLLKNGKIITGAETDFDGNYSITGLDAGIYDVRCSLVGMSDNLITDYTVTQGKNNILNFQMQVGDIKPMRCFVRYRIPLIDLENTSGKIFTAKEIGSMPIK